MATPEIEQLLNIMKALRDPQGGCPWDLQQDFDSIAGWTLEEVYEVLEAIQQRDREALRDELGDLLFQVVYHARMAEEQGWFDFAGVVEGINDKLVRRHPHVFSDEQVDTAEEQSRRWHRIKSGERADKAMGGLLAGVSRHQPSMRRAEKLQMKAAAVGFDWESLAPVFAKVREELAELEQAVSGTGANADAIRDECGDLMFVMVNLARKLDINPELALGRANEKFTRRFAYIETQLAAAGITPEEATLEQMDRLWDEAKTIEAEQPSAQGL